MNIANNEACEKALNQLVTQWAGYHCKTNDGISLYSLIMETIEPALFKAVLEASRHNKSRAARKLGISLSLFRKKLSLYFGDKYIEKQNDYDSPAESIEGLVIIQKNMEKNPVI